MPTKVFNTDFLKILFSDTTESVLLKYQPGFNDDNDKNGKETDDEETDMMRIHAQVHKRIKTYTENRNVTATYQAGKTAWAITYDDELFRLVQQNVQTYSDLVKKPDDIFEYKNDQNQAFLMGITQNQNFFEQEHVRMSPFSYWILQEQDPMGLGFLVSPRVNHRTTDQSVFIKKEETTDELLNESTEYKDLLLQNGPMIALPYEMETDPNSFHPTNKTEFLSTVRQIWHVPGEDEQGGTGVILTKSAAKRPNDTTYKALAGFFGYHKSKTTLPYRIQTDQGQIDLQTLMTVLSQHNVTSVSDLNKLLAKLSFHFRYNEDKDPLVQQEDPCSNFSFAIRHFSAFFRMITPLRLAIVEGNHRSFLINRVMQGHTHTTRMPLPLHKTSHGALPAQGTLMTPLHLRIIYFRDKEERQYDNGLYVKEDYDTCVEYSQSSQELKQNIYVDNYLQILRGALDHVRPMFQDDIGYFAARTSIHFAGGGVQSFGNILARHSAFFIERLLVEKGCVPNSDGKAETKRDDAFFAFVEKSESLFSLNILTTDCSKSAPIDTHVYYKERPKVSVHNSNQYQHHLYVGIWLLKASLARTTTKDAIHRFLSNPKFDNVKVPRWLHDALILPAQLLTEYFTTSLKFETGDKRKPKLLCYIAYIFLEVLLDELASLDIPLRFVDEDMKDNSKDKNPKRLQILNCEGNKDIRHLLQQQRKAKRHMMTVRDTDPYKQPCLAALCLLYAIIIKKTVKADHFQRLFDKLTKKEGCFTQDTIGDTGDPEETVQLPDNIQVANILKEYKLPSFKEFVTSKIDHKHLPTKPVIDPGLVEKEVNEKSEEANARKRKRTKANPKIPNKPNPKKQVPNKPNPNKPMDAISETGLNIIIKTLNTVIQSNWASRKVKETTTEIKEMKKGLQDNAPACEYFFKQHLNVDIQFKPDTSTFVLQEGTLKDATEDETKPEMNDIQQRASI